MFKYQRRSPFALLLRIAKYELERIDYFLQLARKAQTPEQVVLELRRIAQRDGTEDDDLLVDDFAQLGDFAQFASEFAIFALWRCIELFQTQAVRTASGGKAVARAWVHKRLQEELSRLGITECRIRCARSVNELRCLNNAIKHNQYVSSELAAFGRWRTKKGSELGNLECHYRRLRPPAERYLDDLERHSPGFGNAA
jgi:hypothetical protein